MSRLGTDVGEVLTSKEDILGVAFSSNGCVVLVDRGYIAWVYDMNELPAVLVAKCSIYDDREGYVGGFKSVLVMESLDGAVKHIIAGWWTMIAFFDMDTCVQQYAADSNALGAAITTKLKPLHSEFVHCLCVAHPGQTFVSASQRSQVWLWRWNPGEEKVAKRLADLVVPQEKGHMTSIVVTPPDTGSGAITVVGGDEKSGTITAWHLKKNPKSKLGQVQPIWTLQHDQGLPAQALAFHPDSGHLLATFTEGAPLRSYEMDTGHMVYSDVHARSGAWACSPSFCLHFASGAISRVVRVQQGYELERLPLSTSHGTVSKLKKCAMIELDSGATFVAGISSTPNAVIFRPTCLNVFALEQTIAVLLVHKHSPIVGLMSKDVVRMIISYCKRPPYVPIVRDTKRKKRKSKAKKKRSVVAPLPVSAPSDAAVDAPPPSGVSVGASLAGARSRVDGDGSERESGCLLC